MPLGISPQVGTISINNSTSTVLAVGGVFTGTSDDLAGFAHVSVFVYSSNISATDGLQVQWSTDNTNWDDTDKYTIPALTGKIFTFGVQTRYMRVVYTDGGQGQTAFRLQTILHNVMPKPSSHRIAETLTGENDAELVIASLLGQRYDGTVVPLTSTRDGLNVDARATQELLDDLLYEVRLQTLALTQMLGILASSNESFTREDLEELLMENND